MSRVELGGAPAMDGLTFRTYGGPADAPRLAAIREACRDRDGVDVLSSMELVPTAGEIAESYVPSDGLNPAADVLLAEVEGQTVGYSVVEWWRETDGTRVYLTRGWVVPEWRGRGLGTAMVGWAEDRLRAIAATHPRDGKRFLAANASETETDAAALLSHEGYRVAFTVLEYEMASLSGVAPGPLPDGFLSRPLVASDLPGLFQSIRAAYAEDPFSEEESYDDWVEEQMHLEDWHVAWDASTGSIAAQVRASIHKGRGEIWEVSVAPAYRRRGLASALLSRGLADLRARGITSARVHTLAENPHSSPLFYQAAGFRLAKRFPRYRKPLDAA
jgi:mycothiol synthase